VGLDDILGGGFVRGRLHVVGGKPGTGKTTLAMQFILAGRDQSETVLYVTMSETRGELQAVARSHGWSLEEIELYQLLAYLNQRGVLTILVMAQHGLVGAVESPIDLSYLSDAVVLLRFFEAQGTVRKAISVVKKRVGTHEDTIRVFRLSAQELQFGEPLTDFPGVMSGIPTYVGSQQMIKSTSDATRG
jgi:archaellum biogenesis ATPase FlaH